MGDGVVPTGRWVRSVGGVGGGEEGGLFHSLSQSGRVLRTRVCAQIFWKKCDVASFVILGLK